MAPEVIKLLTQDDDPGGTTLVDDRNGFIELNRLAMIWTVHHRWTSGARFVFNCYRNWAQLILCQPCDAPVILLSRKGVTQGEPLLMVLYGISLVPLAEELRDVDPNILSSFYSNDSEFDGSARRSVA